MQHGFIKVAAATPAIRVADPAYNAAACVALAEAAAANAAQRILIGGKATVTEAAARVFAEAGILLIGNESQTVGPENAPMAVHLILLGADIVLLEGLVLSHVPAGKYFLTAAPIHLGGCEGAPCRAILMKNEE